MTIAMAGLLNQTSPVLTAGMGQESLAERLARLAAEARERADYAKGDPMATNPDAPQEGPALAAVSGQASPGNQPRNSTGGLAEAVAPRSQGGNSPFRSGAMGIPNVAMGSGGDGMGIPDANALAAAIEAEANKGAAPQPAAPLPGGLGAAVAPPPAPDVAPPPRPDSTDGLAPVAGSGQTLEPGVTLDKDGNRLQAPVAPQGNLSTALAQARELADSGQMDKRETSGLAGELRRAQANAPVVPQLDQQAYGSPMGLGKQHYMSQIQPPTAEQQAVNEDAARGGPPEPPKQLTPEEEAKANQKPLGKKGAIAAALNIAADAFAGMAGQKGGYTAAQFDKRRVELKDAAETIRKERARLEGEQEKAYNRRRQEQLDTLREKEVNAQIEDNRLRLGQNYEIAKARLEQAKTEGERKAAKDEVDRLVKESQIRFKEATIEKLKKNGTVIQPGGQYAERDPISGEMVVVLANELQTVTTTDQSNTKTMVGTDGKTYVQKDDTTTTTTKGTAPGGVANKSTPEAAATGISKIYNAAGGQNMGLSEADFGRYLDAWKSGGGAAKLGPFTAWFKANLVRK